MSCLFRRSNGIWYIAYADKRRRRWLSTSTRCFGKAHTIFRDCSASQECRRPLRISNFLQDLQSYASADRSKGTMSLYAHSFNALIRCITDKPIRFVSVKDIERYKTERLRTVSPVTVNVEFRTLRAAFNVAVRWGILTENVFAKCRQLRVPLTEPPYLSREEFNAILGIVKNEELRTIFRFAVSTMMRRGEIVNLEWDDVELERKLIHVRNKNTFTVKGQRPRTIPMSESVFRLLTQKDRNGPFVFVGPAGQYKPGYLTQEFKKYARQCNLHESIHFHSLRHTGATWLIQQDVPLFSIQKILGHSSPVMTQIYSHLSDQNLRFAIERIDNVSAPAVNVSPY